VAPSRHALEYIRGRSSVKDNSEEIAKRASELPDSRARNKTFPISFYEILLSKKNIRSPSCHNSRRAKSGGLN
jgi:hypothetical protein